MKLLQDILFKVDLLEVGGLNETSAYRELLFLWFVLTLENLLKMHYLLPLKVASQTDTITLIKL